MMIKINFLQQPTGADSRALLPAHKLSRLIWLALVTGLFLIAAAFWLTQHLQDDASGGRAASMTGAGSVHQVDNSRDGTNLQGGSRNANAATSLAVQSIAGSDTFSTHDSSGFAASEFILSAILWDDNKPLAVIGDEIISVGSTIENYTVTAISLKQVILTSGNTIVVLRLPEM